MSRILILHTGGLGDHIITLNYIYSIKISFPNHKIDLLCPRKFISVYFVYNVLVDSFYKHKNAKYDYFFDLSVANKLPINSQIDIKEFKFSVGFNKGLNYTYQIDCLSTLNIKKQYDKLLGLVPEFKFKSTKSTFKDKSFPFLNKDSPKPILIAPGSAVNYKIWPAERYSNIINTLVKKGESNIILVGSSKDVSVGKKIEKNLKVQIRNLIGKTSISDLVFLVKNSKLIVSNDSAVQHIAELENVPCIVLFGKTNPHVYGPDSKLSRIITPYDINLSNRLLAEEKDISLIKKKDVLLAISDVLKTLRG